MNKSELKKILNLHAKWRRRESGGCRAYLVGADLRGANLRDADLRGAYLPAPAIMLLALWGDVSDDLTTDLMLYDAENHPDPSAFKRWAEGGECPYSDVKIQRAAYFAERKDLWPKRRRRVPSAYKLMVRLIRECCKDSDFHEEEK